MSCTPHRSRKEVLTRLHFSPVPLFALGNWIPSVFYYWGCWGHNCGLSQAVFTSDRKKVTFKLLVPARFSSCFLLQDGRRPSSSRDWTPGTTGWWAAGAQAPLSWSMQETGVDLQPRWAAPWPGCPRATALSSLRSVHAAESAKDKEPSTQKDSGTGQTRDPDT